MKPRELNDYQAVNLHWLLRNIKTRLPALDTGDWFAELMFMTEGAGGRPNAGDVDFDHRVKDSEFVRAQDHTRTISDIHAQSDEQHWKLFLTTSDREALGRERTEQLTNAIKRIERERDEAIIEMQAGKTINAGHLLRLNTARDVIARRDRRIADLEAVLRAMTHEGCRGRKDGDCVHGHEECENSIAALRGAPAQPATATKEGDE